MSEVKLMKNFLDFVNKNGYFTELYESLLNFMTFVRSN